MGKFKIVEITIILVSPIFAVLTILFLRKNKL
jgi:hypothetical protein